MEEQTNDEIIVGKTRFMCGNDRLVVTSTAIRDKFWAAKCRGSDEDNKGLIGFAIFSPEYIIKHKIDLVLTDKEESL